MLKNTLLQTQFRGVTVYGVTDLNDGSDATRKIDTEVEYARISVH